MSNEGLCTICANHGAWVVSEKSALRENYLCNKCKGSLRYRNQSAAIVSFFGRGVHASLRDLGRDDRFNQASVYEIALRGPFVKYFSKWKNYTRSYQFADTPIGQTKQGVRCEDLGKLTFKDSSFDLIVSSDVMEHVFDYEVAFTELLRVLKPGGYHIFTIPLNWPLPNTTVKRAVKTAKGRIDHLHPPHFHVGGDDAPSLVCTEFGRDILDLLTGLGYNAWFARPSISEHPHYRDAVVVAQRPTVPLKTELKSSKTQQVAAKQPAKKEAKVKVKVKQKAKTTLNPKRAVKAKRGSKK